MTDLFQEPDDATPLEPAEREGLLQSWVTHRRDLNEAERENILRGALWARRRRGLTATGLLDGDFIWRLHGRMFGDVWKSGSRQACPALPGPALSGTGYAVPCPLRTAK